MNNPEVIKVTDKKISTQPSSSRKTKRLLLLVLIPAIVIGSSFGFYLHGGRYVETDNAYVKAHKVPVSAEVSGMVQQVMVRENESVASGQILFKLDPAPYQVALEKAQAKVKQAQTDFAALKASYQEKQAEIKLAKTRYEFAKNDQKRQVELAANKLVSASTLDTVRQNTDIASQQVFTLEEDLHRIAETMGGSADTTIDQFPGYLIAEAGLSQAQLDLSRVTVHASVPGIVTLPPSPGEYVSAGKTIMALVANDGLWVEANFPETDLTYVKPGQLVSIAVDTYPTAKWQGKVESLSPATGAEFSIIPAQNATGNWVKITQRVPVRIALDLDPALPTLRAGLSTTVEIDTGHTRQLKDLF
jgi:membrane fusion protein, multidrug efflux system